MDGWGSMAGLRACCAVLSLCAFFVPNAASAQNQALPDILVRAYQTNPLLNAERARQRATDENVPQALSNYRPQLSLQASAGLTAVRNLLPDLGDGSPTSQSALLKGYSVGLTLNQTLFNGFKTGNQVRQAESQVRSGREALRGVEQSVLLDAVTAYTNVLANQSLVEAQRASLNALREALGNVKRRLDAGDVTPTDVAQAEARYNRGIADLNNAEINLAVARATFVQVVGVQPGRLLPADPIDTLLPRSREDAMAQSRRDNPAVVQATYDIDVSQYNIRIAEAALYPTIGVQGNIQRQRQNDPSLTTTGSDQASITGNLNLPIYDGGLAASQVRQAKETLSQTRILLDRVRTQADLATVVAWTAQEGAKVALSASESEVRAANTALQGVQREVQAGQRTTIDLLNALQELTLARSRLIGAQRDRVVASYTLLAAIGRLDHAQLKLHTPSYEPQTHYTQVRDAWHGVRTPSGQ